MVFINRLQPADGRRDALIGLLREYADPINADPINADRAPKESPSAQSGTPAGSGGVDSVTSAGNGQRVTSLSAQ